MKCYVDSNVLLSYFKRELGGLTQAQMIRAEEFLVNCSKNSHKIVLSDLAFFEIKKKGYLEQHEVEEFLESLGVKCLLVRTTNKDIRKARQISNEANLHYSDARHTQLALKSRSKAIVTWNIKDFKKVRGLITVMTPEQFI